MTKSKTNALDSLRALIAERQQYDQWIGTLESKRENTPQHVFERVSADYRGRLERVVNEIKSHAEELQLSIAALSSRLSEVAKEQEAKRDSIQEAELRAAVGEYDASQWESMRTETGRELEKIDADRGSLESQLAELESIRKLSEVSVPWVAGASSSSIATDETGGAVAAKQDGGADGRPTTPPGGQISDQRRVYSDAGWPSREPATQPQAESTGASPDAQSPPLASTASTSTTPTRSTPPHGTPVNPTPTAGQLAAQAIRASAEPPSSGPRPSASPAAPPPAPTPPPRKRRDTPTAKDSQISSGFTRPVPTPSEGRPEVNKTLKCPECGTPNYPTEWYCERCGGELATV